MPVITVDKIEVIFEKQPTTNACKWLILIKVRKKNKERIDSIQSNTSCLKQTTKKA